MPGSHTAYRPSSATAPSTCCNVHAEFIAIQLTPLAHALHLFAVRSQECEQGFGCMNSIMEQPWISCPGG